MNTAISTQFTPVAATQSRVSRPGLLGGIGGLAFASSVVVQNALKSTFPKNDASAQEVMRYYTDHHSVTVALSLLMPLGLIGLTTFLGTVVARAFRGAGRVPAIAGAFGAAGIIATFTMLTAVDVALGGYVRRATANASVVEGMWVLHNAIFGFLLALIGIALVGLTQACSKSGLLSKRWGPAGIVGGGLLLIGATTTPAIVEGSPTMFIGVAGFVVWLAFVIRTSVALLRSPNI